MMPASSVPASESTVLGSALPPGVEERFLEAGGVRFRYLRGGAASGLPILFLHGWPTWAEVWLPVARELGARHPWIAVDLPCQGRSSLLPKGDRILPSFRRALGAFLDALGLPKVALVGNSMGGSLAIMLAVDRPSSVAQVAVLDAAGLNAKFPGRTVRMYAPFLLPGFFRAPGPGSVRRLLTKAVFHDPSLAGDVWVRAVAASWKPADRRRALMDAGFALRRKEASVYDELPGLSVPTLVLSGREDVQFPWPTAEAAAHRIPNARFAAIDGAGHFPMVEKPQETARLLSDFLDGPGSPTSS